LSPCFVPERGLAIVSPKLFLLGFLTLLYVPFAALWLRSLKSRAHLQRPGLVHVATGALTDFLDTLGIGSFAITTSIYKLAKTVDDALIPGTLNIGHAIPTLAQALIFIAAVEVDLVTLVAMTTSSAAGAWLGAGVVSRLPKRRIQLSMGVLLLVAATIVVLRQTGTVPPGGDARGLEGILLVVGVSVNFVLGALMTFGIGLYAPCMILVSLLGMDVRTAFPIMMGSCALLMPAASARFLAEDRYDARAAVGLTLGGTPAVLVAGLIVKSLPLEAVQWLVVIVVVWTSVAMLRSASELPRPSHEAVRSNARLRT
jgi:uncharacterized membrane protein YfcA